MLRVVSERLPSCVAPGPTRNIGRQSDTAEVAAQALIMEVAL